MATLDPASVLQISTCGNITHNVLFSEINFPKKKFRAPSEVGLAASATSTDGRRAGNIGTEH